MDDEGRKAAEAILRAAEVTIRFRAAFQEEAGSNMMEELADRNVLLRQVREHGEAMGAEVKAAVDERKNDIVGLLSEAMKVRREPTDEEFEAVKNLAREVGVSAAHSWLRKNDPGKLPATESRPEPTASTVA